MQKLKHTHMIDKEVIKFMFRFAGNDKIRLCFSPLHKKNVNKIY